MSDILTAEELRQYAKLLEILPKGSPNIDRVRQLLENDRIARCKDNFLPFVQSMWPSFISGRHHKIMADAFERIANGTLKRLIINMSPRHTKSEFASYLLPAWFLGKYPEKKIIQTAHTAELAVGFGRKARNLINSIDYQTVFKTKLSTDSKAAGRWNTSAGGDYFAIGVGGAVTGKGADLLIIDDPHALPLDTAVPTPQGFKTIGDLVIGDSVYGPDGLPTRVIAKSTVCRDRELFAVTTDDNEVVYCDGGHLWSYHSETALKNSHIIKTSTARELANWDKPNKPYLPRHYAVQYSEADLPIDPYVLGAWLGDGTSSLGRMTAHPDDALFMRTQFEAAGYEVTDLKSVYSFGIPKLRGQLRDLGVLNNKHVPTPYLQSSVSQRLALLQGMMDTDGDVTEAGQCNFNNTNKELTLAVCELVHSLGVKAKIHRYEDSRVNCSPIYRVTFKLKDACRMPRKQIRTFTPTDKRRRSFTVSRTDRCADVQCITVEREDGQFLVGRGYVVTHNSEQEAMQGNPEVYDRVYEWYSSGPRQRLQPGGAIVIVMCMTGDTPVLMSDGSSTELRHIRNGDSVATYDYEKGLFTTSTVNNWQSSGVDSIYTIQTRSGRTLRANEDHPFLVDLNGDRSWIKLKDLQVGMSLVAMSGVQDQPDHKQSPDYVLLAKQEPATTGNIQTRPTTQMDTTGNGKEKLAANATSQQQSKASANLVTPSNTTLHPAPQNSAEPEGSRADTGSLAKRMTEWLQSAATAVMSVVSHLLRKTLAPTGTGNSVSTTTTAQELSEDCSATIAISQLDMEKPQKNCTEPLNTYSVSLDQIVDITPCGEEEVFDIEVDRTGNFIANGVVSHNTRWSKKDLTGQILSNSIKREGDEWEVIEFPAIMPSGKPLWPEFWSQKELEAIKAEIPVSKWNAQYQQNPTSEEGAIIKRDMWKRWKEEKAPPCDFIIQSWDTAFEKNSRADYSACTTWGVFGRLNDRGGLIHHIILLDAFKERMEFPDLKTKAMQMYKDWKPDSLIIEKKAAGAPLIYELRRMGIPLQEYTPTKGNDKIARVNAISDLFASGFVWCPETRWADEVVEDCAEFPNGEHDDIMDSTSQALLRFRQGGFITLDSDEDDDPPVHRKRSYY